MIYKYTMQEDTDEIPDIQNSDKANAKMEMLNKVKIAPRE